MGALRKLDRGTQLLVLGALQAGANMKLAAHVAGVGRSTFYRYLERNEKFAEEVEEAKALADDIIERDLWKEAHNGNVTAMIFWLKNRRPQTWRDKHELDLPPGALGAGGTTIQIFLANGVPVPAGATGLPGPHAALPSANRPDGLNPAGR